MRQREKEAIIKAERKRFSATLQHHIQAKYDAEAKLKQQIAIMRGFTSAAIQESQLPLLADIVWWIKGYQAAAEAAGEAAPFGRDHVEALRDAMEACRRALLRYKTDITPNQPTEAMPKLPKAGRRRAGPQRIWQN